MNIVNQARRRFTQCWELSHHKVIQKWMWKYISNITEYWVGYWLRALSLDLSSTVESILKAERLQSLWRVLEGLLKQLI